MRFISTYLLQIPSSDTKDLSGTLEKLQTALDFLVSYIKTATFTKGYWLSRESTIYFLLTTINKSVSPVESFPTFCSKNNPAATIQIDTPQIDYPTSETLTKFILKAIYLAHSHRKKVCTKRDDRCIDRMVVSRNFKALSICPEYINSIREFQ